MRRLFLLLCLLFPFALHAQSPVVQAQSPVVAVLRLDTTVQPVSAGYLQRGLDAAAAEHATAVLIEMNTPGGLLDSMREMVHGILNSPVPVIVYVNPAASRAGSAGFFLLEAADIAAMAPGTNAGAAHPVVENGKMDPILRQKLENDATALLRSYTVPRKRNVQAAEDAVLHSKSYSATESLQLGLIDLVSPDVPSLLRSLDGRTVTRLNGTSTTLHLQNARLAPVEPELRERILGLLMDPNLAVLLLVAGALLIYFEFNAPGTIIPGALGSLLVVMALFALNLLPLRHTAGMLLVAAVVLFVLEVKVPSHGVLAMVAIGCLVFGLLTLVAGPVPELEVRLATALGAGTGFGLITFFLVKTAMRARNNKIVMGPAAMIGALAITQEPLEPQGSPAPRGQVLVRGELWLAECSTSVPAGARVRVIGVRGLTLLVQAVDETGRALE